MANKPRAAVQLGSTEQNVENLRKWGKLGRHIYQTFFKEPLENMAKVGAALRGKGDVSSTEVTRAVFDAMLAGSPGAGTGPANIGRRIAIARFTGTGRATKVPEEIIQKGVELLKTIPQKELDRISDIKFVSGGMGHFAAKYIPSTQEILLTPYAHYSKRRGVKNILGHEFTHGRQWAPDPDDVELVRSATMRSVAKNLRQEPDYMSSGYWVAPHEQHARMVGEQIEKAGEAVDFGNLFRRTQAQAMIEGKEALPEVLTEAAKIAKSVKEGGGLHRRIAENRLSLYSKRTGVPQEVAALDVGGRGKKRASGESSIGEKKVIKLTDAMIKKMLSQGRKENILKGTKASTPTSLKPKVRLDEEYVTMSERAVDPFTEEAVKMVRLRGIEPGYVRTSSYETPVTEILKKPRKIVEGEISGGLKPGDIAGPGRIIHRKERHTVTHPPYWVEGKKKSGKWDTLNEFSSLEDAEKFIRRMIGYED
jgi:hypothetical protein